MNVELSRRDLYREPSPDSSTLSSSDEESRNTKQKSRIGFPAFPKDARKLAIRRAAAAMDEYNEDGVVPNKPMTVANPVQKALEPLDVPSTNRSSARKTKTSFAQHKTSLT